MGTYSVNSILIAGKTRDKLQPWEPKQDKKCLNFQVFPWGKNNNDEKGGKKNQFKAEPMILGRR